MCEKCDKAKQATECNIIRPTRSEAWISIATDTCSEYVKFNAFLMQRWLRERALILRLYLYYLSS